MADGSDGTSAAEERAQVERVLVLGANGPSGRLVVQQALDRGLGVKASTRRPEAFPIDHDRLEVVGGDATDPTVMDSALAGCDAVVSVIGSAYTRKPVSVYSASARALIAACRTHAVRRVILVTSAEVAPESAHQGSFVTDRIVHPVLRHLVGRTVYDDMTRMEHLVRTTALDWTIVRPPGLTDAPGIGYASSETRIAGAYCARADLAAFLLDQLDDTTYLRAVAAVTSPGLRVSTIRTIRREVLKR
jgi:putative NADH-flavin reductase